MSLCVPVTDPPWAVVSTAENGHDSCLQVCVGDHRGYNRLREMLSKVSCHANMTNDNWCSLCGAEWVRECVYIGERENWYLAD